MGIEHPSNFSELPWHSALMVDGRFRSDSGISGRNVIKEAICDELTDILGVGRIPPILMPTMEASRDGIARYRSFWAQNGFQGSEPIAPSILIPDDAPIRALVEEISHFIFDYYQTKGIANHPSPLSRHRYQQVRDVTLYDEESGKFLSSHESFDDLPKLYEENPLNLAFLTLQESLAHTLVRLYFNNELADEPSLKAQGKTIDDLFVVSIAGVGFLVAFDDHKDQIVLPDLPEDPLASVKTHGILEVIKQCDAQLMRFCSSIEAYYSSLPEEIGRKLWISFVSQIPALNGIGVHNIGYSIGDRCAKRIAADPQSKAEFVRLAMDTTCEIPQLVHNLVLFGDGYLDR